VGIKVLARKLSYCPHFKPRPLFTSYPTRKHDEFKEYVKDLMEKRFNVKCETEFEIKLANDERGFIDIVCQGEDTLIIAEVKSYGLARADTIMSDLMQLLLYAYSYVCEVGEKRNLRLYLVYKDLENRPLLIEIGKSILKNEIEVDVGRNNSIRLNEYRFVSPLCVFCDANCPFKSI
jgi:hypothetical protein